MKLENIKNNFPHILAIFVLTLVFLLNTGFFTKKIITTEDCEGGKCAAIREETPNLSADSPTYYIDNIFKSEPGKYYRLVFWAKSDKETEITANLAKTSREQLKIKMLKINSGKEFNYYETIFDTQDKYVSLFFEKSNSNDKSDIFIKNAEILPLMATNEKDLNALDPSVVGGVDIQKINTGQSKDLTRKFSELGGKDTTLGQIFRSVSDYLTGVSLAIDIAKDGDGGSREYSLELREVDYDGKTIKKIGSVISNLNFSVASDIEKYRQPDGTFRFPLFAALEKDKYYSISIGNGKVDVDKFNYLVPRGSVSSEAYPDGTAYIKRNKTISNISGDLFFKIYGAEFGEVGGKKVIPRAIISDSGKGSGQYNYKTMGLKTDLLGIDSSSGSINFDESKKVVFGEASDSSNFAYNFYTIYPFRKINFSAQQAQEGWRNIKVFYSFDGDNWPEIPYDTKDGIQTYNYDILGNSVYNNVYVKITYDPNDAIKSKNYGLKNLRVSGDLIIK